MGARFIVTIRRPAGRDLGQMELEVTSQPGKSCLASSGDRLRLVRIRGQRLQPPLYLGSAPTGSVEHDRLLIDLSAPISDAYFELDGSLTAKGASGDVSRVGLIRRRESGTFEAVRN